MKGVEASGINPESYHMRPGDIAHIGAPHASTLRTRFDPTRSRLRRRAIEAGRLNVLGIAAAWSDLQGLRGTHGVSRARAAAVAFLCGAALAVADGAAGAPADRAAAAPNVPVPHRVHSRSGPLPRARSKLVEFGTATFPYTGLAPRTNKPFLDVDENGRRGHRTGSGRIYWEDETYSDRQVLLHLPKSFDIRRPSLLIVFFHGHG